jgi:hypothetical protein
VPLLIVVTLIVVSGVGGVGGEAGEVGQEVASFNWSPECKYRAWEGSALICVTLSSE